MGKRSFFSPVSVREDPAFAQVIQFQEAGDRLKALRPSGWRQGGRALLLLWSSLSHHCPSSQGVILATIILFFMLHFYDFIRWDTNCADSNIRESGCSWLIHQHISKWICLFAVSGPCPTDYYHSAFSPSAPLSESENTLRSAKIP